MFSFRSTCHGTSPSIIHSKRNAKQVRSPSLPCPPLFSEVAMVKDHATSHATYITQRCHLSSGETIVPSGGESLEVTRLSSNEGQPTISSSSCNIQAEWAHGSALAPFGTCNKLNQLPRHLRDKLHKRAVRARLHGLVFCALARRVYTVRIYRRE